MTMSKELRGPMWYLLILKNAHRCYHMIMLLTLTNNLLHGRTLMQRMMETVAFILSSNVFM